MATFPALKPATRTYTPGRYPHSEIATLSGLQTRVRVSNVLVDRRLQITFAALTEAEMLSIRSHYLEQQGRFLSFNIPDELLNGVQTPADFTPTGYSWIYADRPQVTDIGLQRYDVSVVLATVPPEGANVNGVELAVGIAFITVTPMAETISVLFLPGSTSVESTGLVIAVTTSFAQGAATGS